MLEIEHKFLVLDGSWRSEATRSVQVVQGYFTQGGDYSLRLRIVEGREGVLSIKSRGSGLVRSEYEYPVPLSEAQEMLEQFCAPRLVCKRRYYVEAAPFTWEIDVFEGRHAGLMLAEIEVPAPETVFARPAWLGPEVTGDLRYLNETLAVQGLPAQA